MDKDVFVASIMRMLDDKIIETKEKYCELKKTEFKGPAILMLLCSNEITDDDLYIDYYNEEEKSYKVINTRIDALNYIKKGKLKYITIAYSDSYIDNKIINDIKDYIVNFNIFSDTSFGHNMDVSVKNIIIDGLIKNFSNRIIELGNEITNCLDILNDNNENSDDILDISDYYYDDENDEDLEIETSDDDDIINQLYNIDNIESIMDISILNEWQEIKSIYNGLSDDYGVEDVIEDKEYFDAIVRKYYELHFKDKQTIYLEPIDRFFKYDDSIDIKDKYRKMLIDIFDKLSFYSNSVNDVIYIMINIINGEINLNSDFYESYVGKIKNYNEFFDNLKYIIISDYYTNIIINENIIDEDDKMYLSYIREDVINKELIKDLFEFEKPFAQRSTLGFLNYNSFQDKINISKKDEKILEKIDPFKK